MHFEITVEPDQGLARGGLLCCANRAPDAVALTPAQFLDGVRVRHGIGALHARSRCLEMNCRYVDHDLRRSAILSSLERWTISSDDAGAAQLNACAPCMYVISCITAT